MVYSMSISQTKGKIMAKEMIISKVVYFGEYGGTVLCEDCAGMTLKGSIRNAMPNQVKFTGVSGETFWMSSVYDLGVDCEGGC